MSKRDRDARRQLDDLFGTDSLGQRSSPRQDRDTWAAGRAENRTAKTSAGRRQKTQSRRSQTPPSQRQQTRRRRTQRLAMTLQCPYCNWHIHAPVNDACPICQLPRPTPTHLASACAAIQRVLTHRHPEHHWIVEIKRDEPHNTPKP